MTPRTLAVTAAICSFSLSAPARAQSNLESVFSTTIDSNKTRYWYRWDVSKHLSASMTVSVDAIGTLPQSEGARFAVYHANGTPVDGGEILAGHSTTFNFEVTSDTYYVVVDFGVASTSQPSAGLQVRGQGFLTDWETGVREPYSSDLPPGPNHPPASIVHLNCPYPIAIDAFLPPRSWSPPRVETLRYLRDEE